MGAKAIANKFMLAWLLNIFTYEKGGKQQIKVGTLNFDNHLADNLLNLQHCLAFS